MSTINLLPDDYVQRRWRRRANVICFVLFVLVMAGVLGAQLVSDSNIRNAKDVLSRVNAEYAEAARLIEQMRQLQVQEDKLQSRAKLTASLIERVPRSALLAVITQALPKYSSLLEVELQIKRVVSRGSPGGTKPRTRFSTVSRANTKQSETTRLTLKIKGLAATNVEVARFIANLARCPLIASVDFDYSKENTDRDIQVREFQVKAELKPDADAIALRRYASATDPLPSANRGKTQARRQL